MARSVYFQTLHRQKQLQSDKQGVEHLQLLVLKEVLFYSENIIIRLRNMQVLSYYSPFCPWEL